MRYSNEELLRVMQQILAGVMEPELQTAQAQTAAHFTRVGLDELIKRSLHTPALLQSLIAPGIEITASMLNVLETAGATPAAARVGAAMAEVEAMQCDADNLSGLGRRYNALVDLLELAARELVNLRGQAGADQSRISDLLQQAAWWEYRFFEEQGKPLEAAGEQAEKRDLELKTEPLEAFIRRQLPEAPEARVTGLQRVPGGMGKETSFFELDTGIPGHPMNRQLVVRKSTALPALNQGPFNLSQEYAMVRSAHAAGIRAPQPFWLGEDVDGISGTFFISERRPGKVCGTFIASFDDVPESFWLDAAGQLAHMHRLPLKTFSDYIQRWEDPRLLDCTASEGIGIYLNWWQDYWKTFERMTSPAEIFLMDWLFREIPRNDRPASLIHGDYGSHNLLQHEGKLSAILDWEAYLFGDPAFDLAYVKKYVSANMDWDRFLQHYYACGGPETDESTFGYFEALQFTRVLTASTMTAARMRFQGSTDLKDFMLALGFLPEMMRLALASTR